MRWKSFWVQKTDTIVLVEDSENDIILMRHAFRKVGMANPVIELPDGEEAIHYFSGTGEYGDRQRYPLPCLIITDLKMPRMDGFELTAKIRASTRLSELPVVLVTALESREDRERGIEVGASAYMVKSSFDQGNLLEIIGRLI